MAKRTTVERETQPSGKEIRVPADQTVKTFDTSFDDVRETVDEANTRLKDAVDVAKKKHLNMPAHRSAKGLFDAFKRAKNQSIAAEKLAAWLANFDKLRKYYKLDELANLQGRMFAEGEIGGEPDRTTDEDGEQDPRPRHLRQPGASVTSIIEPSAAAKAVQDLATKSGATMSGGDDDPLNKVGRGKPH